MSQGPIFPPVRGDGNGDNPSTPATPQPSEHADQSVLEETSGSSESDSAELDEVDPATGQSDPDEGDTRRRAWPWWMWAIIAVGVLLVGIAIVIAVTSNSSDKPAATVTVTAPAPTPTATAIAKEDDGSALYQAIPQATNQFVLSSLQENDKWAAEHDAREAYDAVYQGPASLSGESVEFQVTIAQFDDSATATSQATALTAELIGADTALSDVTVAAENDGKSDSDTEATEDEATQDTDQLTDSATLSSTEQKVGSLWAPLDGLADDDSPAALVWTNETVVVTLQGPANELQRFFEGFGL